MKRISLLMLMCALGAAPGTYAQDAATAQRLDELTGRIDNALEGQEVLRRQISDLSKRIDQLQEQLNAPKPDYAGREDVAALQKALRTIDAKRMEDYDKIRAELLNLRKGLLNTPPPPVPRPRVRESEPDRERERDRVRESAPSSGSSEDTTASEKDTAASGRHFEYKMKKGDSLSAIIQAYRDKNIKVTLQQILKANPGMNPDRIPVGKVIIIPAPPATP